jgi:RHS repeat-associated protein
VSGVWRLTASLGWSGSVTPWLTGYSFTPVSRNYTNVTGALTGQDFTATEGGGPAAMFYIHADHLNSPRLITNQAGQAVWRWDQSDPFGGNVANENPSDLGTFTYNLRFPGQYFDKETNLHYNYYRDYDPATGRYVQSDPIGFLGGINTYGYVDGNPLSLSDPTGLLFDPEAVARAAQTASRLAPAAAAAAAADGPLPVGDLIAVGVIGGAVILELCRDKDDCLEIQRRIERALSELRKRYVAMTGDKNKIYLNNMFGPLGWENHRKAFEQWKRNLAKNVALAKSKGCPYNPEADEWLTRSPPSRPSYAE